MEHIRQAAERAKGARAFDPQDQSKPQQFPSAVPGSPARNELMLNATRLEASRIVAHDISDPRSKSFDMLRTQVLQSMDANFWQFLGVTSPTPGCGKSLIAANLALSIARQPERLVLLVDMDLQKPQMASQLGIRCNQGLVGVLEGKVHLAQAVIPCRIRNSRFLILPCEVAVPNSSEWLASRAMAMLLSEIKRIFQSYTVILDLPPMLLSDDVISILPQLDCALFVAAAGQTTSSEIKECTKYLEATPLVRVVLNKATDTTATHYYTYSRYGGPTGAQKGANRARRVSSVEKIVDRLTRF